MQMCFLCVFLLVPGSGCKSVPCVTAGAGLPAIQEGVTNHSLRRTFASLLYEAGASPAYVMSQLGHTSSALALEVYARKMARSRDTGARMDALLRSADWAQTGTDPAGPAAAAFPGENRNRCLAAVSEWAVTGSNRRPPACKAGALPAELTARTSTA